MLSDLKPYLQYRDSGLSGFGRVPSHWEMPRAKFLLYEVDERSLTGEEELLSVSHKTGVTPRSEKNITMFLAESNVGHKLCKPGDVVINTMWAWMAALGVSNTFGIVSPSYGVYRPLSSDLFLWPYLDELLRTPAYRYEYMIRSSGITDSRLRLYPDAFLRIPLLCPPGEDQSAIVRYLGHMGLSIRRHIGTKQKLIKLLAEQKWAIVHQAITRGLDADARLKPSGVERLGDVPDHWQLSRVKSEFQCLNRYRVPLSSTERGAMSLRHFDYYGASGVIDKVDDFIFDDELLLVAEDGANLVLRNLPLAIIARGQYWVNNHAHILKVKRGHIEYLALLMETVNYLPWISGAAQPKLTQDRLMSIPIAVPPPEEQTKIVASLQVRTRPLEAAIDRARREISLLQEFGARLTADVVTGKLDVRTAAYRLPDEINEEEKFLEEKELIAEDGLQDDVSGLVASLEEVEA